MIVTRMEIAEHVSAAFDTPPASRSELLDLAIQSHARPAAIAVLQTLPERDFGRLRELWPHLAHLPVSR